MLPSKRTLAILLAANYLLAIVFVSRLHNHGVDGCCECAHTNCCPCNHRGHNTEHHRSSEEDSSHGCPTDHQGCPACRLLAEKPIPVVAVVEVTSIPLEVELIQFTPRYSVIRILHIWQSRAPPAIV